MHESSLVRALLRQVTTLVERSGGGSVLKIHVEVGPLSGVESMLLAAAFERLAPESPHADARLAITEVPLLVECEDCGRHFEPPGFRFRCPRCSSNSTRVIRGDGLILESIDVREIPVREEATT